MFILLTLNLSSCATNKGEKLQKDLGKVWSEYFTKDFSKKNTVKIFVVTNRDFKIHNLGFGCNDRHFGVKTDANLKYGSCLIKIPRNHTIGKIELAKNDKKYLHNQFKALKTKPLTQENLVESIKKTQRTPLVFVHGFNVHYEEALLRSAQIAYDLKYQGPVILFTWPAGSGDGVFDDVLFGKTYQNNLVNAKASIEVFKNLLLEFQRNKIKVNLIAHSMGHQVVLPALQQIGKSNLNKSSEKYVVNELILNAPDFSSKKFTKISKEIKKTNKRTTIYCSYNDKAIIASQAYNQNSRLGGCSFLKNIDNINVSLVDDQTLGLGHGYYSSRPILSDIFQTILGIDVEKRLFIKKSAPYSKENYYLRK